MIITDVPRVLEITAKWTVRIDGSDCYLRETYHHDWIFEIGPMPAHMIEPVLRERVIFYEDEIARLRMLAKETSERMKYYGDPA